MRTSTINLTAWLALLPALALCQANQGFTVTADQILQIAPSSATCVNSKECATAEQAAGPISKMLQGGGFSSAGEKAALVSLMLFESGGLKYNRNHFPEPGNPGQGTRNMQSPHYNALYADWIVAQGRLKKEDVEAAKAKSATDKGKAVLDLLLPMDTNDMDFGSAGWFLNTQCKPEIRDGLKKGTNEAWEAYITQCVQTTVTEDRRGLFTKAMQVFGGTGGASSSAAPSSAPASSAAPASSSQSQAPASSAVGTVVTSMTSLTTAVATTLVTQASSTAAAASGSAAASAAPQASASSAPAGNSSASNGGSTTCSGEGTLMCNGVSQYGICGNGVVRVWQQVATGTKCQNGQITWG